MAHRPSASRNLSLTEELERLEQQITLTLQEIDSNFSKAHRIVTSSLLPIVEQYAKHSNDVWQGSEFWKQFFEASANITLSNYEEGALDERTEYTQTETDYTEPETGVETPGSAEQHAGAGREHDDSEDFTLDSPTQVTGVQSTPKLPASSGKTRSKNSASKATASSFRSPSPRKYSGKNPLAISQSSEEPSTPAPSTAFNPANAASSPFQPASAYQPSTHRKQNNDYILHRNVLDKNYRVQATPHTQRRMAQTSKSLATATPQTATRSAKPWDDSPDSSPEISAPQLRSDLFSPAPAPRPASDQVQQPRTPGLSVLTPGRPKQSNQQAFPGPKTSTGRSLFSPENTARYTGQNCTSHIFSSADSDSDSDDGFAMSPPKTMQFHVPQSKLLQTPAREASRRIVEDLLLTAGGEGTEEIERGGYEEEPSPSVIRKGFDEDDTF